VFACVVGHFFLPQFRFICEYAFSLTVERDFGREVPAALRALMFASSPFFAIQHFHFRRLLLILLSGSFAVFSLVNFRFMPFIRAQKESRRLPPSGCGRLRFPPVARLYARRPSSLKPPLGDL